MSRFRKKHPFCGITTATTEKEDKRRAHRTLRRVFRDLDLSDPDSLVVPLLREVSNVWSFGKDGKQRFDPKLYPKLDFIHFGGKE